MRKKKLLAVILSCVTMLVFAAVLLVGCGKNLYSELSKISNGKYDNVSIKISTEQDGATLTSTFDIKNNDEKSIINYSVENFAPIDADTGVTGDDTVTTVGTVVLESGKVTQQTGDALDINFGDVTKLTLHFAERNFAEVKTDNGIFSAKVTDPKAFMDAPSLQCTDMTVTFSYAGSAEHVIVIHYTSQGGVAVTLTYTLS